jgi:GR25 family glycosyltransferase involved in LPS biosynthesis
MNINKIFVVHYTKLQQRKQSMESYLKQFGVQYEYIDEYDQEVLTKENISSFYYPEPQIHEEKIKPLWDASIHKFRILNTAEISCTIKHLLAVKKVSESCTDYGLILEDDCMPKRETFIKEMKDIIRTIPDNWDGIFFGEGCGQRFIDDNINKNSLSINNGWCQAVHPASNCAEAYLLKPAAAKKVYEASIPFQLVSDWELASSFYRLGLNIYWAVPPVFEQGSKNGAFKSTLR